VALHIIKLAVGVDSVEDLEQWQAGRLAQLKTDRLMHVTRMTPKRRDEVLDGGSLYWVVKGYTCLRQRIVDLKPVMRDGVPHCGIVYDGEMVQVVRRQQRPFQGWRYLNADAAPADLDKGMADLPAELQLKLSELGLL
jgi:hypothetical protein